MTQIDKQIAGATLRVEIASKEVENHDLQTLNAAKVEETLRSKYTNQELYSWMSSRVSEVYYQTYKLAHSLAKRAERCYQFETGVSSSSFIRFGYWDGQRSGLLAGAQMMLDLKRLENAYVEANRREYEMTRQVSLVLHDPSAFIALRETGACDVVLPEELFDADYPGHYFRRLKTVSVTLPCVAGPYTSINCTLTLIKSQVRISAAGADGYRETEPAGDERFRYEFGSIQRVATSHGNNDAGLFEVNFRDERYLPFEGAGAVSTWRIELPRDTNAFDFETLSDVVLKLSYTARDGGAELAKLARASLRERRAQGIRPALQRLFHVRYEFSDSWQAFVRNADRRLKIHLGRDRFPFLFRGADVEIKIAKVAAHVLANDGTGGAGAGYFVYPKPADEEPVESAPRPLTLASGSAVDEAWVFTAAKSQGASIRDVLLVVTYDVSG